MNGRLKHFYLLRTRGIKINKALQMANIDLTGGIFWALILLSLFILVGIIDHWSEIKAEALAAPYKAQAEENLKAFNLAMQGRPFLIGEDRALLTCKAQEVRL